MLALTNQRALPLGLYKPKLILTLFYVLKSVTLRPLLHPEPEPGTLSNSVLHTDLTINTHRDHLEYPDGSVNLELHVISN